MLIELEVEANTVDIFRNSAVKYVKPKEVRKYQIILGIKIFIYFFKVK